MKRYGMLILIAVAGCSPKYEDGKTQCSTSKECPSGYTCKDDGTSAAHYCFDGKTLGCPPAANFYCSQSNTCWAKPGVCSTVALCNTTKHPGSVICASANYHPDCNGDVCLPNGAVPDSGAGGVTGKGGSTGTIIVGVGGFVGTGGAIGTGGIRDAGPDGLAGAIGTGGTRDAGVGGAIGTGGIRDAGAGGAFGTGGITVIGGASGKGGAIGTGGGSGSTLCSGTPYSCSSQTYASDCTSDNGCVWSTSTLTCSGTPLPCSSYSNGTYCIYNGCSWAGALVCNPTTLTTYCSGLFTASSTACTICEDSSCCGQLTNCVNDTNCSTNYAGPYWNAYLDCVIGCCGSASYCGLN